MITQNEFASVVTLILFSLTANSPFLACANWDPAFLLSQRPLEDWRVALCPNPLIF